MFRKEYFYRVTAFLLESELSDSLIAARRSSDKWFEPFEEFERLAGNQPRDDLPKEYPRVTEGTLASNLEEETMRLWGKLQTGRAVGSPIDGEDFDEWKTEIVNTYWVNKIIPNANTIADFFTKVKVCDEKAGIYGSQPVFVFPVSRDGYTGADFTLPYIKDVKLEPGKVSDRDCSYIWFARHYTKTALRDIIDNVKGIKGNAGWDVKALQKIIESDIFSARTGDLHRDENSNTDMGKTVTFHTCFQRGYGSPFLTVYTAGTDDANNVIRREKNTDPDGDLPIFFDYYKQNFINPYGVSRIELIGPGQNMLDFMTAAQAYSILQAQDPAITVSGKIEETGVDLDTLVISPGNLMLTGDSEVKWFTPDKTIIQAFPSMISSYKTNVLNMLGTNDGTVSGASSGNTQFSKVPASIKQMGDRRSARDNSRRQGADSFMARLAKLLINTAVQNSDGSEAINITSEQGDKLRAAGYNVPEDAKEIITEFEELKSGHYKFEVDAGTSKFEDDDATKARVVEAIDTVKNIPDIENKMKQDGREFHWGELVASLLDKMGLDNIDKIVTKLSPQDEQTIANKDELEAAQTQAALDGVKIQLEQEKLNQAQLKTQAVAAKTSSAINGANTPTQTAPSNSNADEQQIADALKGSGWSDQDVEEYLSRLRSVA